MIHENQTDWQRQLNFDINQSSHSNESNHGNNESIHQHHDLQDIFGRSTKRPISAPPTSDEMIGNNFVRNKFSPATNLSGKAWGNGHYPLYRNRQNSHSNNELKDDRQLHLPNRFDFDRSSEGGHNSGSDFPNQASHRANPSDSLSSSSVNVLSGLDLFSSSMRDNSSNAHSNSSPSLNNLEFLQNGLRRPASTGIIGNPRSMTNSSSSVMESLGLGGSTHKKQTSKLDLIQEDFPKTLSAEYTLHETKNNGSNSTSTSSLQYAAQRETYHNSHSSSNGNTSSLPVSSIHYNPYNHNHAEELHSIQQQQQRLLYNPTITSMNNVSENHMYSNTSNFYLQVQEDFHLHGINRQSTNQQNGSPTRQGIYQTAVKSGPAFLGNDGVNSHTQQVLRQQATLEQVPVSFEGQQRNNNVLGGPNLSGPSRMIPSGSNTQQPIYVNPNPYGTYTTVQYHQGTPSNYQPNPIVLHPNDHSLTSRLIPMPVQGPIPAQVSNNGAYIYFHPPSDASAINIIQTNNNRRNQFKATPKVANERSRKNSRAKKNTGLDNQENGVSAMLEEFRSEKNRLWTAVDIKGHIVEFCQDQNGSRFIQQRLEVAGVSEKALIMEEILPEIGKLRVDIFGNYVVQKLFDFGTPDMIDELKQTIVGNMLELSKQNYGCRVVQKALEIVSDESLLELLSELHDHLLPCIHDQNGNHVIQKCVEVINSRAAMHRKKGNIEMEQKFKEETKLLMKCVTKDILSLSCHPYGCRVFQRILEHFDDEQKGEILHCLRSHHKNLLDDQYGNYVIQHVLRFGQTVDQDSVLEIVVTYSLLQLSRQKFASNVVEKLLKYGNDSHRRAIVREMLKLTQISGIDGSKEESSVVLMMVRDAYANYVVQTTLDVVPEGEEKRLLFEELNNNSTLLRNFTFAKHIITKLGAN